MPKLTMENLTDDDSEKLLVFARQIARMTPYKFPLGSTDAYDDAVNTMNDLIRDARKITTKESADATD